MPTYSEHVLLQDCRGPEMVGFGTGMARALGAVASMSGRESIVLLTALMSILFLSQGLASRMNADRVARNIAEASAHSRSLFLANMRHEIRTHVYTFFAGG